MFIAHLHICRLLHLSNSSDCFTLGEWRTEESVKGPGCPKRHPSHTCSLPAPPSAESWAGLRYYLYFLSFCVSDALALGAMLTSTDSKRLFCRPTFQATATNPEPTCNHLFINPLLAPWPNPPRARHQTPGGSPYAAERTEIPHTSRSQTCLPTSPIPSRENHRESSSLCFSSTLRLLPALGLLCAALHGELRLLF